MPFVIKGFLLGLAIAAPVGPATLLCINGAVMLGFWQGLFIGLGPSFAIGILGIIAGFGCTFLTTFMEHYGFIFNLCGAVILFVLGIQTILKKPVPQAAEHALVAKKMSAILPPFLLTLINPMTVIVFLSLYTGFGLSTTCSLASSAGFAAGVFLGAFAWFTLLAFVIAKLRRFMNYNKIVLLNRGSGILLLFFACMSLYQAIKIFLTSWYQY